MTQSDATKGNARYAETTIQETSPIPFLAENIHRLGSGRALVLAAGRGRNAVFLAECGFDVTALDVSEVGLAHCDELARSHGVSVETVCADLDDFDLGESRHDLITKIYYYEPSLFPAIRLALKPCGRSLRIRPPLALLGHRSARGRRYRNHHPNDRSYPLNSSPP